MKKDESIFLQHILESIERIEEFVKGMSKQQFLEDVKTQDAVLRRLEIIGEAAKNLPEEFKKKHREIPWREIVDMRNIVVHKYFGVDLDITWEVVKNDLPDLKKKIKNLLKEVKKK